ncbi:hypothetical protein QK9_3247 [Clostridioides difficile DA00160]|nr:hypothetical protein QK9_3247 [Clostridioides difficile DA00160]
MHKYIEHITPRPHKNGSPALMMANMNPIIPPKIALPLY